MFSKITLTIIFSLFFCIANATQWVIDENYQIDYQVVDNKLKITFTLKNGKNGWMGIGFNKFMYPADTIIAWWDQSTNQPIVWDAYNPGIPTLVNFPAPIKDDNPIITIDGGSPLDNQENVKIISATNQNGTITIVCERPLQTGDIFDFQFEQETEINVVAAYNDRQGFINEFNAQQPNHTAVGATKLILPGNKQLENLP